MPKINEIDLTKEGGRLHNWVKYNHIAIDDFHKNIKVSKETAYKIFKSEVIDEPHRYMIFQKYPDTQQIIELSTAPVSQQKPIDTTILDCRAVVAAKDEIIAGLKREAALQSEIIALLKEKKQS